MKTVTKPFFFVGYALIFVILPPSYFSLLLLGDVSIVLQLVREDHFVVT